MELRGGSKYDSHCSVCGNRVRKGMPAWWKRDESGKGHLYCSEACEQSFDIQEDELEIPEGEGGGWDGDDEITGKDGEEVKGDPGQGQNKGGSGQDGKQGEQKEKQPMMDHTKPDYDGGYNKKQEFIRDALEKGHNTGEIYKDVKPLIGKDERWIVRKNTGNGERGEAYDQKDQESKTSYYINRTAAEWEKDTGKKQGQGGQGQGQEGNEKGQMKLDGGEGEGKKEHPIEYFYRRTVEIRKYCDDNAGQQDATRIDQISLRPIVNGVAAIKQGINPDALLHAMICHWPVDKQKDVGVKPVPLSKMGGKKVPGEHDMMGYVMALAEARVPIMLVGPAGTGKSFMARALARLMFGNDDSHYGEAPLTAGAMPSWLIGAETVAGYKSRPFLEIYENGGVFNFEEIDAADANMLMVLNNALAQDRFYNPANGKIYVKHEDFIAVSTGNTWGLGANRFYNAREKLDFATRDRWRMGRVRIELDTKVERGLIDNAIAEFDNVA